MIVKKKLLSVSTVMVEDAPSTFRERFVANRAMIIWRTSIMTLLYLIIGGFAIWILKGPPQETAKPISGVAGFLSNHLIAFYLTSYVLIMTFETWSTLTGPYMTQEFLDKRNAEVLAEYESAS